MALVVKSVHERDLELIKRLINRLEHLSADSIYAHQASGLRGSLLRYADRLETSESINRKDRLQLEHLIQEAFKTLELAAKEVGAWK